MAFRRLAPLLSFAFGAAACAQAPIAATPPPPAMFSKSPVPFALLRQSWIEDLEAHRLLASVAHYAPDADFLTGEGTRIHGSTAIRELYTTVFARFDADIHLTSAATSASGELAYDSGSYHETLTDRTTHAVLQYQGQFLTIYRQIGRQWLIVQQAFTENTTSK